MSGDIIKTKLEDREQLIYDLRKFADKSPYLSEINKVGANEIINFFNKLNVTCPFCGEVGDFDKIGLKMHFQIYCKEYATI